MRKHFHEMVAGEFFKTDGNVTIYEVLANDYLDSIIFLKNTNKGSTFNLNYSSLFSSYKMVNTGKQKKGTIEWV